MSKKPRTRFTILSCLLVCVALAAGEDTQKQKLDRQYQSAVADYEAQRYSAAAEQLEKLLPYAPESFEIHELLGLTYASLSQNGKAMEHLKKAVQLQPNSAEARTNFGTSLLQSGSAQLAGEQFRKALALEPQNYDTNHNLGEYYVRTGKLAEALPLLEAAQKINPDSYDNGYDLAMTNFVLGRFNEARAVVQDLLKRKNTGELHSLLGQIEEKDGKFVAAANEFEIAAHMDPSEDNLFAWGSEMLLHRTYEPAIAIFQEGAKRYPNSPRILIGLGLSLLLAWQVRRGCESPAGRRRPQPVRPSLLPLPFQGLQQFASSGRRGDREISPICSNSSHRMDWLSITTRSAFGRVSAQGTPTWIFRPCKLCSRRPFHWMIPFPKRMYS